MKCCLGENGVFSPKGDEVELIPSMKNIHFKHFKPFNFIQFHSVEIRKCQNNDIMSDLTNKRRFIYPRAKPVKHRSVSIIQPICRRLILFGHVAAEGWIKGKCRP